MERTKNNYDIAVVGGGPAGSMAAIRASELKKNVALLERNDSIGRKLLITGKGRCNITNTAPLETFMEQFGEQGKFLRTAFFVFGNEDLMDFFKSKGLELKSERQGRVFPVTDNAKSVVKVLEDSIAANNVKLFFNTRLRGIKIMDGVFTLELEGSSSISAKKVILSTGGASYKVTGSSGDGFAIAKELGHTIIPLRPGLVALKTKEAWVKDVQGLTLRNVRITFFCGRKKIVSSIGELLFTHFGVSGPLVLDLSAKAVSLLNEYGEVALSIDLKPALERQQIENKLLSEIKGRGAKNLNNFLKDFLPVNLIPIVAHISGINITKQSSQFTRDERLSLIALFKGLPLTIIGALPLEEAMVTGGGVSTKEIDPRTMESKIVPGLYFAGEIIEGAAASGGYNLQQAFSTGYLAGEKAANA